MIRWRASGKVVPAEPCSAQSANARCRLRLQCLLAARPGNGYGSFPMLRNINPMLRNIKTEELQVLRAAGLGLPAAQPPVRPERDGQEQRAPGVAGAPAIVRDWEHCAIVN